MRTSHGRVRRAVSAVATGRPVVVMDDGEAQGYLVFAADAATPELLTFTVRHGSGYVRVALPGAECERLNLPPVCHKDGELTGTAGHRVAVDFRETGTGISAIDRARTIAALAAAESTPADFRRPGHVIPVRSGRRGVLGPLPGAAEAAVDLAVLGTRRPAGVLCELVSQRNPAEMAGRDELASFAEQHRLPFVSIAEIATYRRRTEPQVVRSAETTLPTAAGTFRVVGFRDAADGCEHLAMIAGNADADTPMPVYVHIECLSGDVFGSLACRCGAELDGAVAAMREQGTGMVIYLRPPTARACGVLTSATAPDLLSETVAWILRDLGVYTVRLSDDAPELGLLMFGAIREHGLHVESAASTLSAVG
ncbi:3,4-dihydroxy 2-butanone 4-phosphate synthase/GTP cyclohydrolase II [Mycolicibacterium sp. BK556]|uniref:3,4-dihydroxy-2-butanone-4-phosphate synthase n=1 Tax=Mycobacteriaceae TaxID=1762 RepID=UPI00105F0BA0|nr:MULTISPECIES: 3,4-dihydroxy-2-butanone-4-phosphate synthase [Mycobacteriaceae]MBB3600541.1 3,4-dihydroxy 2-butanone 4-phosphate synthase/GTP cyclohydrolase II [Mycolicibacterium sp. BK556]MBB3630294.1 3,4-dihydroxy 2-butanone 4-phosphate synthase/GTP cyclohydrolase II [Mycolicibacterium sp. BK607]TDO10085.1 3,4-dihydroxy 2-butanone 4-phosphate synthase/GTP cyclohydrolase II [Mycobacterium sp. BK086]